MREEREVREWSGKRSKTEGKQEDDIGNEKNIKISRETI